MTRPTLRPAPEDQDLYAAPQQRVRINSRRRLNLMLLGRGSPAVVFFSGLGGGTFDWRRVQPAVAEGAKCVSFDYAGV
ncbi:MAG: alpha/beta fold hydrolase [bacterium]|jgi:pimeloyl-ACP methyl ester carboxylesterase